MSSSQSFIIKATHSLYTKGEERKEQQSPSPETATLMRWVSRLQHFCDHVYLHNSSRATCNVSISCVATEESGCDSGVLMVRSAEAQGSARQAPGTRGVHFQDRGLRMYTDQGGRVLVLWKHSSLLLPSRRPDWPLWLPCMSQSSQVRVGRRTTCSGTHWAQAFAPERPDTAGVSR